MSLPVKQELPWPRWGQKCRGFSTFPTKKLHLDIYIWEKDGYNRIDSMKSPCKEELFMCNIPRTEHPNPQWERDSWKNLNGTGSLRSTLAAALWSAACGRRRPSTGRSWCPSAGKQALRHWLHRLYQRRGLPPHLHLEPGGAGRQGAAALRRGGLRGHGLRQRGAGGHPQGRGTPPLPWTSPDRRAWGENSLFVAVRDDVRSGLQPKGKQAQPVRFFRLRLHPHHGHLADGVAGVRAPKLHPVRQVLP